MNRQSQIVSLRTAETVENEAADWLAKLDSGKVSPEDRQALKEWLTRDPEHAQALKSLAAIWHDMDFLLNEFPATNRSGKSVSAKSLHLARRMSFAVATVLFSVIGLLVWQMQPAPPPETSFHITSVGKQELHRFSDGSAAYLNTNSMIETEFSKSVRIVRMLRGEALFEVAHDPARPFIVYVGNNQVRALGTKFVVRMTSESIVVTVADGRVQLSKRSQAPDTPVPTQPQEVIVVSKGEEAEINEQAAEPQLKEIQEDELTRKLSWLDGQLVFKNEKLEQVIAEISRYVPDRIIIDDPGLREIRISGRFEIGDTDALLEAIEVSFKVNADHVDNQIIRLSR